MFNNKKGLGFGKFILIPLIGLFLLALTPWLAQAGVVAAGSSTGIEQLFYANLPAVFWICYALFAYVGFNYG